MLYTDLKELKAYLEIDPADSGEDRKLLLLAEVASRWLEEWLNRPGLAKKSRTEIYKGTGTQKLPLRSRPVFTIPEIEVYIDESAWWGSTEGAFNASTSRLQYGEDFALQLDSEDGTSRCGLLMRRNELWPKPQVRQRGLLSPFIHDSPGTIKVIYTAGYTVDTLPAPLRFGCNLLVARMRYLLPVGMEIGGEGYEERSISLVAVQKDYLFAVIKPLLNQYRNWRF